MSSAVDGWALTRVLSPRDTVRLALAEDDTAWSNLYGAVAGIDGPCPAGPWAMYLADRDGYRFLCFDLDAGRGNAVHDASRLGLWLDELNIEHLVAISGPSGDHPVSLYEDLPGLDRRGLLLVLAAIAHASGSHEHSDVVLDDDGRPRGFRRLDSAYPWPAEDVPA